MYEYIKPKYHEIQKIRGREHRRIYYNPSREVCEVYAKELLRTGNISSYRIRWYKNSYMGCWALWVAI